MSTCPFTREQGAPSPRTGQKCCSDVYPVGRFQGYDVEVLDYQPGDEAGVKA